MGRSIDLEPLNLSQVELDGIWQYEKGQRGKQVGFFRDAFRDKGVHSNGDFILSPDPQGFRIGRRLIKRPHKHIGPEKKDTEKRRSSKEFVTRRVTDHGRAVTQPEEVIDDFYEAYDAAVRVEDQRPVVSWVSEAPTETIDDTIARRNLPSQLFEALKQNPRMYGSWLNETDLGLVEPVVGSIKEEAARAGLRVLRLTEIDPRLLNSLVDPLGDMYPESTAVAEFLADSIDGAMERFSGNERQVFQLRFGLTDGEAWPAEKVAKELGCTIKEVRDLEESCLRKLHHPTPLQH